VCSTRASRLALAVAVACLFSAARARADTPLAESLFQEAKALMADGRFGEACPKLAESMRLDPGTGTLLALAVCHEGEGKTATAWTEFVQAEQAAVKDGREDRVTFARERLAAIAPHVSHLVLVVPSAIGSLPDFELRRNGQPIGAPAWNTPLPVDPGEHLLEARANGKLPWTRTVVVGADGDRQIVEVGPFGDRAGAPAEEGGAISPLRVAGLVVGGVGLVAIAVGAYFGVQAIDKSNAANDRCTPELCLDAEAVAINEDAKAAANVANVTIGLGAAAVVAGIVMVIVGVDEPASTAIVPWTSRDGAGLAVGGRF
jgi:hypothetical protein